MILSGSRNGPEIVMCTAKNARKLQALQRNPAVALTIDTEVHRPTFPRCAGEAVLDPWTVTPTNTFTPPAPTR